MTVKWTPTGKNKVHGVVEGFIDPGGISPSWAVNYVQRQAPYLTALSFQRMVKLMENSDSKAEPAFPIME